MVHFQDVFFLNVSWTCYVLKVNVLNFLKYHFKNKSHAIISPPKKLLKKQSHRLDVTFIKNQMAWEILKKKKKRNVSLVFRAEQEGKKANRARDLQEKKRGLKLRQGILEKRLQNPSRFTMRQWLRHSSTSIELCEAHTTEDWETPFFTRSRLITPRLTRSRTMKRCPEEASFSRRNCALVPICVHSDAS